MKKIKEVIRQYKKIAITACLLIVIGAGATAAYLSASTGALKNTFEIGEFDTDTEIKENIDPDITGSKEPYVKNIGNAECIVRMRVNFSPDNTGAEVDFNQTKWTKGEDGYWYYQGTLKPDAETDDLFTKVTVPGQSEGQSEAEQLDAWNDFLTLYPDFNIALYQEASPVTVTVDDKTYTALKEGQYDQEAAMQVWKLYEEQKEK